LGSVSKSIECCREGNIKLLRLAFARFGSLLPLSPASQRSLEYKGLACWVEAGGD